MPQRRLISLAFPDAPSAELALWCQCFTPLTALDPPDGIILDITGCAHLFGGEPALLARLRARFPAARAAVANTAAAAWALARHAAPGAHDIAPLPLAALRLPPHTITRLRRVGVRRIGELARLPRAELTAGYGPEPALHLARALGHAPEPLHFLTPPPAWRAQEAYAEPIFAPAQLAAAVTRLATSLCATLAAAQRGALGLTAAFHRIDTARPCLDLRFAAPCRDEFEIAKLFREKLALLDPGFGIEAIILEAPQTEPLRPAQQSIGAATPDYAKPLNTLLNRLGHAKIWRTAPHGTHIPEYAARRRPITLPPVPWAPPRHPRPIRLLPRPDAITAIAPVPDDPPVLFSWRGATHKIIRATGPERIARDWWCHQPDNARPEAEKIRDYYEVEDSTGARFWLFRAGLHGGEAHPRWYLHGIFG
jgi:protein ImuB